MNRFTEIDRSRLRRLRKENALTMRELSERSDVSLDTILKLEHGEREARPTTLRKLADALGVEPRELLKREEG
jgi:transcriptional regulator with XRE-family HTH domain